MRKLRRAQSEVLGALAMAVLLALAVGAYSRIAQLQSATASELASLASTVGELLGESVLLSVRGDRVLASPNMDSRAVYRAVVAGGEVLWENSTAVELPAGQWSEVYRGQYSELVESCEATVVLVTDRGRLYSWCPTVAGSGGPSGPRLLAELGYKVAFAFVYNVWDLMSRGPVHARTASGDPPTYADVGYRPLLSGNLVFLYSGLTYGFSSGSYWTAQGGSVTVQPNRAIADTGRSQTPAALAQVLRVVAARGYAEVSVRIRVGFSGTSYTAVYPRVWVVYYVLPREHNIGFPAAYYSAPYVEHAAYVVRGVLASAQLPSGQTEYAYEGVLRVIVEEPGYYLLVGVETLTYGNDTQVTVTVEPVVQS